MSKIAFQRLIATIMLIVVIFIDVPSVFKDVLIIILSVVFFFSTFNFIKSKRKESTNL
ncbi:MAG: hypothetical protein QG630_539 [Patescibacteria group bacterium]|nr:hypothetical protein [Patescibacteria group bacterium]